MRRPSAPDVWDRFWNRRADPDAIYPSSPRVLESVLSAVPGIGARILEIGAGTGRDAAALATLGHQVVALDNSPASLNLVARSFPGMRGRGIVGGDALHLPFNDATFDVVFHQGVLEHFGNPRAFLVENHRVLRPGGRLVVDVPQTFHPWTGLKKAALRFDRWFAGWETEFTIDELRRLVEHAGFRVEGDYADWMSPSLAYRLVREAVKPVITLPMEPRGPAPLRRWRERIRSQMIGSRVARYCGHTIGVIARRPEEA